MSESLLSILPLAGESDGTPASLTILIAIIGIPGTVLTAVLTWYTIKEKRLANDRASQEAEQEKAAYVAARDRGDSATAVDIAAGPILDARRAQGILLRFVLLYLILQIWRIVGDLAGVVANSVRSALGTGEDFSTATEAVVHLSAGAILAVPNVGYWVLFAALGYPLLLDIFDVLRMKVPPWAKSDRTRRIVLTTAIIVAIGQSIGGPAFYAYSILQY